MKLQKLTGFGMLLLFAFAACGGDDQYDPVAQQEDFQEFLDSKQILYDQELAGSHYIYKVLLPEEDRVLTGLPQGARVEEGDRIRISYAGFLYNKNNTSDLYGRGGLFTTNILGYSLAAEWYENPEEEPLEITIGDGRLLKGLQLGIPGSFVGDGFLLYLSADYAYGEGNQVGQVETEVPVVYEIYIVEKFTE
ncbi:MAG: FKBP-type peptidyl-prolyl cis-trans isomerase [Rikenellaceae bacterium]|nr:FKBP-type peptidyl-prolyl cis-trans isomerase [Rikenellaceae bacterium]